MCEEIWRFHRRLKIPPLEAEHFIPIWANVQKCWPQNFNLVILCCANFLQSWSGTSLILPWQVKFHLYRPLPHGINQAKESTTLAQPEVGMRFLLLMRAFSIKGLRAFVPQFSYPCTHYRVPPPPFEKLIDKVLNGGGVSQSCPTKPFPCSKAMHAFDPQHHPTFTVRKFWTFLHCIIHYSAKLKDLLTSLLYPFSFQLLALIMLSAQKHAKKRKCPPRENRFVTAPLRVHLNCAN